MVVGVMVMAAGEHDEIYGNSLSHREKREGLVMPRERRSTRAILPDTLHELTRVPPPCLLQTGGGIGNSCEERRTTSPFVFESRPVPPAPRLLGSRCMRFGGR